jgi:sortase (surface protein transpeptidase)
MKRRTETGAAVLAVFVVTLASLGILVGTAPATSVSSTVIALPAVKKEPPKPVVKPKYVYRGDTTCTQMTNPGGRIKWEPSSNAGPWPTGGTVSLPTLGVTAPIVRVGVDTNGHMVVPGNARDVAWLDQGPIPGQTNNVVLAGHIAYSHVRGSFGGIQQLRGGDLVTIEMNGKKWQYRVVWSCLFDRNTESAQKIMGYTNVPSVTMISCGGVWDPGAGTHAKRAAVRAELVGSA